MRVLLLNQTFHPDVAATAQHLWDLARYLDDRGHRVTVITSRFYYGTDREHDEAFVRYGRNIEVHRVRGTGFGKRSLPARLADFGSFYVAAAARLRQVAAPDVVVALTTPPMISLLGALQQQFRRGPGGGPVRFVYYLMDLYPDAAVASGMLRRGALIERALRRMTGWTLDSADGVIVLGRDMRDRLERDYARHLGDGKIALVRPWADGDTLGHLEKSDNPMARALGVVDTFNIVYSGNLGVAHDVETLLAAIEIMRDDPGTRWLFAGGGRRLADVQQAARDGGWTHVRFLPYQERDQLNQSLNLADVHLVSQLPAFTGVVVPSKLFGILAVAKPTVMVGPPDAECSQIVAEHGAGYVVPNGDPQQLVDRLRTLRADAGARRAMGEAARMAFDREYGAAIECKRIEELLRRVTGS